MNRKKQLIATVIVSAAILTGILLIPPTLSPEFVEFQGEWVVTVGETYQFEFKSWGELTYGNYNESEIVELFSLNGTVIDVTITNLPILDFQIIKTSFENEIVAIQKISCILSNGTEIPTTWLELISESISECILPVGSWQTLDAYHPTYNQASHEYRYGEPYFSELHSESFQFGKFWRSIDDGERWTGTISLDTGLPSLISWHYYFMYYDPLDFELTLIS